MPAAAASSTMYCSTGRSTTGSSSLGTALVAGRNRVARPAAGMTALTARRRLGAVDGVAVGRWSLRHAARLSATALPRRLWPADAPPPARGRPSSGGSRRRYGDLLDDRVGPTRSRSPGPVACPARPPWPRRARRRRRRAPPAPVRPVVGKTAMPIETVTSTRIGRRRRVRLDDDRRARGPPRRAVRRRSRRPRASVSGSSTTNSSPPCRNARSTSRISARIRRANSASTASPAACPYVSLTSLKRSRSSASTREHPAEPAGPLDLAAERLAQVAVVPQPGQRVGQRQPLRLLVHPHVVHRDRGLPGEGPQGDQVGVVELVGAEPVVERQHAERGRQRAGHAPPVARARRRARRRTSADAPARAAANGTATYVRQRGSCRDSAGPSRSTRPRRGTPVRGDRRRPARCGTRACTRRSRPASARRSPSPHWPTSVPVAGSSSSTTPGLRAGRGERGLQDHLQDRCRSWVLDRVSPSTARWPRSWSRLAVSACTYAWVSRVIRLNAAASRPTSSRPRTGTRPSGRRRPTRSAAPRQLGQRPGGGAGQPPGGQRRRSSAASTTARRAPRTAPGAGRPGTESTSGSGWPARRARPGARTGRRRSRRLARRAAAGGGGRPRRARRGSVVWTARAAADRCRAG